MLVEILRGRAFRAEALGGVPSRRARFCAIVGVLGVLNVRDEPLLLCVSPNYLEGHGFAWLECSYLRWRFHAVDRHENAAALSVEEYPKRGSEMHHAFDRNEILEMALEHRAGSVASLLGIGCVSTAQTFDGSSRLPMAVKFRERNGTVAPTTARRL